MALEYDGHRIGAMQYDGVTIGEAMMDGQVVYQSGLPVVQITGSGGTVSRDQFRQACIDFGTTYDTVEVLPFQLDTSQSTAMTNFFYGCTSLTSVPDLDTSNVTSMSYMFSGCSALTHVPDLTTSNVTDAGWMFNSCTLLTDGNVRLIGKHPNVDTNAMILNSGLTREPFYDTAGNPI